MKFVYTHAEFIACFKINKKAMNSFGLKDLVAKDDWKDLEASISSGDLSVLAAISPLYQVTEQEISIVIPEESTLKLLGVFDKYVEKFEPLISAVVCMVKAMGGLFKEMREELREVEKSLG